ncbi:MAG TPA: alpha/beta hydrolase, partial [Anaerolineaceae bacterium]|nr:alpha/beta hydrolase [Anaerolineaceae bacterium]
MPLHPFFQQLQAASAGAPPTHSLPLDVIRQANMAMLSMLGEPEPVARVTDRVIPVSGGSIAVRIYSPDGAGPFPVVMTIHGGGWIAGNLAVFDHVSRALVNRVGCIAVSVEHRLAPENKFPIPLHDCYEALVWISGHIAEHGGDPARIAVLGESAGGNIAAALALLARDRGEPKLA